MHRQVQYTTPLFTCSATTDATNEVKHARYCVIIPRAQRRVLHRVPAIKTLSRPRSEKSVFFGLYIHRHDGIAAEAGEAGGSGRPQTSDEVGAESRIARGPSQQRRVLSPQTARRQSHAVRFPRLSRNSQLHRIPGRLRNVTCTVIGYALLLV